MQKFNFFLSIGVRETKYEQYTHLEFLKVGNMTDVLEG